MNNALALVCTTIAAGALLVLPVGNAAADPPCHSFRDCKCKCPGDRTAAHDGHVDIQCGKCNPSTWYCPPVDRFFPDAPGADGSRAGAADARIKKLKLQVADLRDKTDYWRAQRERWQAAVARGEKAERDVEQAHESALGAINALADEQVKLRNKQVKMGVGGTAVGATGNALGAIATIKGVASWIPGIGAWVRAYGAAAALGTGIGVLASPDNTAEIQRGRKMVEDWHKKKLSELNAEKAVAQKKLDEAVGNDRTYDMLYQQAKAEYEAALAAKR